jgi:hypothetical protein
VGGQEQRKQARQDALPGTGARSGYRGAGRWAQWSSPSGSSPARVFIRIR